MSTTTDINRGRVARFEIAGAVFILILGGALHFVFEWSNSFPLVAPFAAVNESVWEHLKLAFWPALVWAFIEFRPMNGRVNNFLLAKGLSIVLMPLLIIALFYGYTALLGHHMLVLDIGTFFVSVFLSQCVSYRLLTSDERSPAANLSAAMLVVVFSILFVIFTFVTPHVGPFQDGPSGMYGILR